MASDTAIAKVDPVSSLNSILDLFNGKETVSTTSPVTRTSTTKSNLTADQITGLINDAMAPLSAAAHGAGLSTYGDTTLALGRAQVAADTAAKYAGTTTTDTSSGGTTTTQTPGALSPSRIGGTAQSLLVSQLGAPILKKLAGSKSASDLTSSLMDYVPDSIQSALGIGAGTVASGSGSAITSAAGDPLGDFISNLGLSNTATSAAVDTGTQVASSGGGSDLFDTISSGVASAFSGIKDWLGFADGGYVDTHVANSNLVANYSPGSLTASGDIAPPSATSPDTINPILAQTKTGGTITPDDGSYDRSMAKWNAMTDQERADVKKSAIVSLAGVVNPILGLVASEALGVKSLQANIAKEIASQLGLNFGSTSTTQTANGAVAPVASGPIIDSSTGAVKGQGTADSDNPNLNFNTGATDPSGFGTMGGGDPSGIHSASGGKISGPGTSTSDSIPGWLSDGERVITAKTVKGVEDTLGSDFFLNLERAFNPPAAMAQVMKGRD